ncbi:MAG: 30S ribosomal protein S12 methylthiotransferase RimO [Bacillota bacterium]|nr:30S ribosomal protein S12 methylthiotransferase RimO [Bacillota bacterium]
MSDFSIGIVSLGCDKNRIDSEIILGSISNEFHIVNDPKKADIILVNTCGFIESSKQESINSIVEMGEYKRKYKCKMLIVTGCLTQRYGREIMDLMPEIDILLGVNDYDKLKESIEEFSKNNRKVYHSNYSDNIINAGNRILTTNSNSAYLRVAEGCDNFCTYCIIPKIRGRFRSRKIEDILEEAVSLAENGVKEIILVAQDTTRYGIDLYNDKKLSYLLAELSKIEEIKWIRILYCYPEEITDELIFEIQNNAKVCKYLDMPIQHISNSVLKRMGRRGTKELITENINKLRYAIPDIILRTTIIVGFPGETEKEFAEVKELISEIQFDKLGVFKYSMEEDTPAAEMMNQIDEEVKEKREKELMMLQMKISKEKNQLKIGRTYDVLVEGYDDGVWVGRSFEMSPEIDGEISVKSNENLKIGDFTKVTITEAEEYDLIGVEYHESCK